MNDLQLAGQRIQEDDSGWNVRRGQVLCLALAKEEAEHKPGKESADMRHVSHSTRASGERGDGPHTAQELQCDPDPNDDDRGHSHHPKSDQNPHPAGGEEDDVSPKHA